MKTSTNMVVLLIEVIALVVPMSLLLAVGAPAAIEQSTLEWIQPFGPLLALAVMLSAAAMLALWVLSWGCLVAVRRFGTVTRRVILVLCSAGAIVALCAFVSNRLPPSPEYSPLWHLRDWLAPFSLGLIMTLPAVHLLRFQRRLDSE